MVNREDDFAGLIDFTRPFEAVFFFEQCARGWHSDPPTAQVKNACRAIRICSTEKHALSARVDSTAEIAQNDLARGLLVMDRDSASSG
jgi:hypothetical protein